MKIAHTFEQAQLSAHSFGHILSSSGSDSNPSPQSLPCEQRHPGASPIFSVLHLSQSLLLDLCFPDERWRLRCPLRIVAPLHRGAPKAIECRLDSNLATDDGSTTLRQSAGTDRGIGRQN